MNTTAQNDFVFLYDYQKRALKKLLLSYLVFITLLALCFAVYFGNKNHITNMINDFNANHTLMCQSFKVSKANGWQLGVKNEKYIFEDANNYVLVLSCQGE